MGLAAGSWCAQVPQKYSLVLLLVFSVLEHAVIAMCTLWTSCHLLLCMDEPESIWEHSHGYSPSWKIHHSKCSLEPKATAVPESWAQHSLWALFSRTQPSLRLCSLPSITTPGGWPTLHHSQFHRLLLYSLHTCTHSGKSLVSGKHPLMLLLCYQWKVDDYWIFFLSFS